MYQLGLQGKKWLKLCHLLLAGTWLGAGLGIMAISIAAGEIPFKVFAAIISIIDEYVIVPSAIGVILTGLLYSIFTNWGFFKFRWVTVKWILTIAVFTFGITILDPEKPELAAILGSLQLVGFLLLFFVSVFKPWSKRGASKRQKKS